ncbi:MAG TPA: hypothetical protein VGX76_07160, partial [Pirellulales bacterium]|nr:hypothetical protein [Pirellulales bacterium]
MACNDELFGLNDLERCYERDPVCHGLVAGKILRCVERISATNPCHPRSVVLPSFVQVHSAQQGEPSLSGVFSIARQRRPFAQRTAPPSDGSEISGNSGHDASSSVTIRRQQKGEFRRVPPALAAR